ncbi:hypothetical protein JW907_07175 [Thermosynechococcus sp. TA-1]|nr:hypothetical protein JW907_07175 [Thermosynechococcus sp. TA-1]
MQQGGKISEATQIFQVSRATIHRWLKREDLAPTVVPRRPWKLDWAALETGFDSRVECEYGWSARGQRIDGE